MKLKQLKQWIEEAEEKFEEDTGICVYSFDEDYFGDISNMIYDFSEKLLKLEVVS